MSSRHEKQQIQLRVINALIANPYWKAPGFFEQRAAEEFKRGRVYRDSKARFDAAKALSKDTEAAPGKLPRTEISIGASTASPSLLVSSDLSPAPSKHIEEALPKTPSPTPSVIPAEAEAPGTVTVDLTHSTPDELEHRTKNPDAEQGQPGADTAQYSTRLEQDIGVFGYYTPRCVLAVRGIISTYPAGSRPHGPPPYAITWDSVCRLGSMGEWVDGADIDWVVLCGGADTPMPSIDYLSTHAGLYAETISGRQAEHETYEIGVLSRLKRLMDCDTMPPNLDSKIKATANAILFAFNPSSVHWNLVRAQTTPPAITIFDSMHTPGLYHCPAVVTQFLRVLGRYHDLFGAVDWTGVEVRYGTTVRQVAHDCGVFAAWAARHFLVSSTPLPTTNDAYKLGRCLRIAYTGEIAAASTDKPVSPWEPSVVVTYTHLLVEPVKTRDTGSGVTCENSILDTRASAGGHDAASASGNDDFLHLCNFGDGDTFEDDDSRWRAASDTRHTSSPG